MSSYYECSRIEIISKYFISEGLILITAVFGWHARADSHSWSILVGVQAKRFPTPFSQEYIFLPNVALVSCQGWWANCHFWFPATKRQRISMSLCPVSQHGPHTLMKPDYCSLCPHRLRDMQCFLQVSVSLSGWVRLSQDCVTPRRPLEGHRSVLIISVRPEHFYTVGLTSYTLLFQYLFFYTFFWQT